MNWYIVYLDDVIVFSKTPDEHLERLQVVFQKLSAAGLKLKPSKCTFFKTEITYLGHLITSEGVATDPKKTHNSQGIVGTIFKILWFPTENPKRPRSRL